MEKNQGFFFALKEVAHELPPSRSRATSLTRTESPILGLLRRKKHASASATLDASFVIARFSSLRPLWETLTPFMEGPNSDEAEYGDSKWVESSIGNWMKGQLSRAPSVSLISYKRSELRLLVGVMGTPLAPVLVCTADPLLACWL